jgi:hypothetical protein
MSEREWKVSHSEAGVPTWSIEDEEAGLIIQVLPVRDWFTLRAISFKDENQVDFTIEFDDIEAAKDKGEELIVIAAEELRRDGF